MTQLLTAAAEGQPLEGLRVDLEDMFWLFFFKLEPAMLLFKCTGRLRQWMLGGNQYRCRIVCHPELFVNAILASLKEAEHFAATRPEDLAIASFSEICNEVLYIAGMRGIEPPDCFLMATSVQHAGANALMRLPGLMPTSLFASGSSGCPPLTPERRCSGSFWGMIRVMAGFRGPPRAEPFQHCAAAMWLHPCGAFSSSGL